MHKLTHILQKLRHLVRDSSHGFSRSIYIPLPRFRWPRLSFKFPSLLQRGLTTRQKKLAIGLVVVLSLTAIGSVVLRIRSQSSETALVLTSEKLTTGEMIPVEHTCDGANV